jgi:tripartite-type tricarboxylate transporter receptor subunit TctC
VFMLAARAPHDGRRNPMQIRLGAIALAVGSWVLNAPASSAQAPAFPTRPITVVVPFPAGGPTDALLRVLSDRMRLSLGQPLIAENVSGATGSIAVGRVVQAPPDGYTVGIGNTATHVINGAVFPLKYDLVKDLQPVALLPSNPFLLVSKNAVPAKDLKELIAWVKASPRPVSAGTPGVGSIPHVAGILFENLTSTKLQFVPYRGAAPALQDLIAGQIDIMFDQAWNSLAQVRAGTIRAYAVTAPARLASAPDIPSVDEAGLPGLHAIVWSGFWVPRRTPRDVIAKLNGAVVDALADPMVRQRLADLGLEIPPPDQQGPEALARRQQTEIDKWWPIVKAANIKLE